MPPPLLPDWYDAACICTSVAYGSIALLRHDHLAFAPLFVASAVASVLFRASRRYATSRGACTLRSVMCRKGLLSIMFVADVALAMMVVYVLRHVRGWYAGVAGFGLAQIIYLCGYVHTSCVIHTFGHVVLIAVLATSL